MIFVLKTRNCDLKWWTLQHACKPARWWVEMRNFRFKTRKFVLKLRNFRFKTRKFVFKFRNCSDAEVEPVIYVLDFRPNRGSAHWYVHLLRGICIHNQTPQFAPDFGSKLCVSIFPGVGTTRTFVVRTTTCAGYVFLSQCCWGQKTLIGSELQSKMHLFPDFLLKMQKECRIASGTWWFSIEKWPIILHYSRYRLQDEDTCNDPGEYKNDELCFKTRGILH